MFGLDSHEFRALAVCAVFFLAAIAVIVLAMLEHQRKMAELIRKDKGVADGLDGRVDALQSEIRELKALLSKQCAESEELRNRVS